MKFRLAICAALVLAANVRFADAQTFAAIPKDVLSSNHSVEIRVRVVAILPVYARALGIAPSANAQENVIETSRIAPDVRFSLADLSALKKVIVQDEENNAAFNRKETWADVIISAPLEMKSEDINEQWKPQIETINRENTFPNTFRKVLQLNVTPTLGDGIFTLALNLSKNLTFGRERQMIRLTLKPDKPDQLMIAPESREYLKQKSVVLQSHETENFSVTAHNDETIAILNLPPEFAAQEFFPQASPSMKIVILVTPHIPRGSDSYVRAG